MSGFGTVGDRYDLEKIIGSGGMGVVYRGHDRVLGRPVAVKMIRQELADPEFVQRFEREAAILAKLRSPYIVVVYDYGTYDGKFYLVTDFLPDGDLASWLQEHGPLPAADAVTLIATLAEGLADAHHVGVIHRDIKPENTLLWRRGKELRPVLADFGIATTMDLRLTATGIVVGSPLYMAPERHLGEPATVASDIYAMGCLLYTVLVGSPPYWGTEFQAANAHVNEPVPRLPRELPWVDELDAVLAACMAKDPGARIESADALAARLRRVVSAAGTPTRKRAEPVSPPEPPEPVTPNTPLTPVEPVATSPAAAETAPSTPVAPPADLVDRPADDRPADEGTAPPRRSARLAAVAAVVALIAVVGSGAAWWAVGREDDDPTTDASSDTSADSSDEVSSEVSSEPPGPPPSPGVVDAEAVPAYRAVKVSVAEPETDDGVSLVLEQRKKGGGWKDAKPSFSMPTDIGGDTACATLRWVALAGDERTPGPSEKICGESRPRTISLTYKPGDCVLDSGGTCNYYDIELTGFTPNNEIEVVVDIDTIDNPVSESFRTDGDGRMLIGPYTEGGVEHEGGIRLETAASVVTLSAAGVERTFDLAKVRRAS